MTNITSNTINAAIERLDRSLTDTERDMVFETCGAASYYLHINNRKADDATLDMLVAVALYAYRKDTPQSIHDPFVGSGDYWDDDPDKDGALWWSGEPTGGVYDGNTSY